MDAHPRRPQAHRPAGSRQARSAAPGQPVTKSYPMDKSAGERPASQLAASSPQATISAGPVRRLAVALGVTVSLPPGTSTVHGRSWPNCQSPAETAAATAAATAPVPHDIVTPD